MTNTKYDIFISFKDLDASSKRTASSLLAEDIYDSLDVRGYNVFYSRRVLPGMVGSEYEPEIENALASSKLLVVVFSSAEEISSDWVKYEWKYFLRNKKPILPVFKDCGNSQWKNMPQEIKMLEYIDLTNDDTGHQCDIMLKKLMK